MKKESKEKHFIKKPIYEGGLKAMRLFIKQNMQFPKEARKNNIKGTVIVKYTVNYKGDVVDAKVVKGIGYGCNEEAIRLAKLLKFKVSKTRKIKIQYHKSIQIHFIQSKATDKLSLKYEITSSSIKDKKSYNYSIKI